MRTWADVSAGIRASDIVSVFRPIPARVTGGKEGRGAVAAPRVTERRGVAGRSDAARLSDV
jgi:hypothetical protein